MDNFCSSVLSLAALGKPTEHQNDPSQNTDLSKCLVDYHLSVAKPTLRSVIANTYPRRYFGASIWFYTEHIIYLTGRSSAFMEALRRRASHVHTCSETTKVRHFDINSKFMITSKAYLFRSTKMKNQPWVPSRRDITDLPKKKKQVPRIKLQK